MEDKKNISSGKECFFGVLTSETFYFYMYVSRASPSIKEIQTKLSSQT